MTELDDIASFDEPPIVEAVASVRFHPMPPSTFMRVAELWSSEWASDLPEFSLQPPYQVPNEDFEGRASNFFGFEAQFTPSLPRLWMNSQNGRQLVQLQHDWFACNWRKTPAEPGLNYERWAARRSDFESRWRQLRNWLKEADHVAIPTQFEVTYVNHLVAVPGVWDDHGDFARVFQGVGLPAAPDARAEQLSLNSQWRLPPVAGLPDARLHVSINPALGGPGPEPTPIYVLNLTVRGAPSSDGEFGPFGDRGRRAIVETFLSMTSQELQKRWGRK